MTRMVLAPLLVGFVAVPACFYVLPPQDALDRWFFATLAVLALAILVAIVTGLRGARVRTSLAAMSSVMLGAVIAHVGLGSVGPIHDRRYCEAHQRYAQQALQQAAAESASSSCSSSDANIAAAFERSRAEHFSFTVERTGDGSCVLSATGEGYQAGCDTTLTVHPDGKRDVERSVTCADKCD